ncbi:MAG: chemotaxis protein CheC, partial [Bdellovibrionota bacterium]
FSFEGEARGLILAIFERTVDISAYTELGNILASQTADRLSRELGGAVLISPPKLLSEGATRGMIARAAKGEWIHRSYTHLHGRAIVPVEIVVIPIPSEGVGNA